MHAYRTHTCNQLTVEDVDTRVRLSGWIHRKRDHGGLLFVDMRDHYGITQCVTEEGTPAFELLNAARLETVITVTGTVVSRTPETVNSQIPTGHIEVRAQDVTIQSDAETLPLQVNSDEDYGEDVRLRYRFLDLRRQKMQRHIVLRSDVIASIRNRMKNLGFREFQTPILTASSPEGARDFLVPSRLHRGQFYALPQAPQQFKQLLMIAGFDRYFQIAPCFRDEDPRADRSPGEFYQLDFEMSFVTQEDVFSILEELFQGLFEEFSDFTGVKKTVSTKPFRRIPYEEALALYGTDKPDLRNPLLICDVTDVFVREDVSFKAFRTIIEQGGTVRAIRVPDVANQPRSFFDKLNDWARGEGMAGLGYIVWQDGGKGPIAKFLAEPALNALADQAALKQGDAVFFVCDQPAQATKMAGLVRTKLAETLSLINDTTFEFCWIVDFPMFERDEDTGVIDFSHNPFSMPQGGMEALENQDPLDIKAWQYDIVCNGYELSSGAIRNHVPEIMYKAFSIAGYDRKQVEEQFGGVLSALKFGAPPHGGSAPGIDRIVMLLAGVQNLREITAFPLNQKAQDLMMNAPSTVDSAHLRELGLTVKVD